jgi:hypothetical protein
MLTKQIDIAKTSLKELLVLVHKGTSVVLTEGDAIVARLTLIEYERCSPNRARPVCCLRYRQVRISNRIPIDT